MEHSKDYQPPLVPADSVVGVYLNPAAMDRFDLYSNKMMGDAEWFKRATTDYVPQSLLVRELLSDTLRLFDKSIEGLLDVSYVLRRTDGIAVIEPALDPSGKHQGSYDICTPRIRSWGWNYKGIDWLLKAMLDPIIERSEEDKQYITVSHLLFSEKAPVVLRFDPEADRTLVQTEKS